MKHVVLDLPTFAFVLVTRAALAGGIALLLSERVSAARRRVIGGTLLAIGAATTVPAAIAMRRGIRLASRARREPWLDSDDRLIGAARFPRKGDDDVV